MARDFVDYELMFFPAACDECYDVAQDIVEEIKVSPLTPVRTGKLRRGYRARRSETGAEVTTTTGYSWEVEYGTEDTPRQSHIRPAVEYVKVKRRA